MTKHDTSDNAQSSYRYLHLTPEELAHVPPAELLQACLESRSLLQTIIGILSTPDASPTERVVACDLIYAQAMRMSEEEKSHLRALVEGAEWAAMGSSEDLSGANPPSVDEPGHKETPH